jgi:hypothetical protein
MAITNINWEEAGKFAEAVYQEKIRPTLTKADIGKFVIIDVNSGEYEIGDDDIEADQRLQERVPDVVGYIMRVGYSAAYSFGWYEEPKL